MCSVMIKFSVPPIYLSYGIVWDNPGLSDISPSERAYHIGQSSTHCIAPMYTSTRAEIAVAADNSAR